MLRNALLDLMANCCSLTSFMVWRLKKLQQTRNMVFHHDPEGEFEMECGS